MIEKSILRISECVVFFFCQIIWQILSYTEQNKFHQKLSQCGLDPQPP